MISVKVVYTLCLCGSRYIPEGYHAVTAAINMPGAAVALNWYKTVFNAREKIKLADKSGMVIHAEIEIDGNRITIAEKHPGSNGSPKKLGGTTVIFSLYAANTDETIEKAVAAGQNYLPRQVVNFIAAGLAE